MTATEAQSHWAWNQGPLPHLWSVAHGSPSVRSACLG